MIKIPGFTIEKEIGHGGMATVYLGVQDMLKRDVALKVMLPEMVRDTNFRNSFMSEGEIIASLDHPNIVRIHDIGIIDDTTLYMAMEYLSGNTLKEKLSHGKLSFPVAFNILEQVASGLAYAHDKGYIHRDIKPGNILFRENGTAVITDFGIAKLQDTSGELTRMGYTMGTVQYMSPEQVVTTDLDHRSDIYSLGLIFYEMLSGLKAFKAETAIQAIHQHTTLPPPSLDDEYSYLQGVIDKVLAKEPENRYQSTDEFVKAIKNAESLGKTVIHRIQDDDKTEIFIPNQSKEIPKKNLNQRKENKEQSKLLPVSLAVVALIGLFVFGAIVFTDSETSVVNDKPIAEDKVSLKQKPSAEDVITSTDVHVEKPIKADVALNSESTEKISIPKTKPINKPITYLYQPKIHHAEVEKELDSLAGYSIEILAMAPENKEAQLVLASVLDRYYLLALDLVKSLDSDKALSLVEKGLKISSDYEPLIKLKVSLENNNISQPQLTVIQGLLKEAEIHTKAGRFVLPKGQNALEHYQKVLTIDPYNSIASKEINSLLSIFEKQVRNNLNENDYQANEFLNQALSITPFNAKLIQLQSKIRVSQRAKP